MWVLKKLLLEITKTIPFHNDKYQRVYLETNME